MAITRIKNNQITDATITNVKILSQTLTGDLMNPNLTFNSNLVLNGNLTVTGNVTAVQSTTTQITDPLLTLGLGNAGTSYDLGLVLIRGSGGNRFIGFKENLGAFVFINTTEDGLTTGNIATTAYSNVIFGNATTLGSSTFGGITLSGNTISAAGVLTVRSDAGTVTIPNATIISSTLSVSGATTVDSLRSNAGIIATTGSFSSNLTASALTVNTSAVVGTTLQAVAGIQATAIGNVTASTGAFTTLDATGAITGATTITTTGTATLNALNVNNAATAGTTLTVGGTATVNALVSNGSIQGTTLNGSGNATVSALTVNNSATIGTTLGVTGNTTVGNLNTTGNINAGYFFGNGSLLTGVAAASASTAVTVTGNAQPNITSVGVLSSLTSSGNITASGLTINNSATVGTTLGVTGNINGSGITLTGSLVATGSGDFDGGLQSTPIGNAAPSTALFTTVGASSNATVAALTVNGTATFGSTVGVTGTLTGAAAQFTTINGSGTATLNALNVNNAATAGTTLTVGGTATVNALVSNTTFTAASGTILGNLLVEGNLAVLGNLSYINVDSFTVEDPIIQLNTGPNGAPLSVDNNFDSGVSTNYYDGADRRTFFGRKDSSGFFEYFSNVASETGNVITGTYGTIKSGNLQLVSAATIGTTVVVGGNATVAALTVNASAVVGTTLQAVAGIQATPIGNVTASTGNFTTVGATGTATVNALVSNGAVSGTTAQFTTVNSSANATVNGLTVNTSAVVGSTLQAVAGIQATPIGNITASSGAFTTLNATGAITGATTLTTTGTATLNAVNVNNAGTVGTTLTVGGTATVNALISNGAIQGTTLSGSANATVNGLTVNTSAVVGTTLQAVAGIQATPIGNVTASSGAFTTLNATGAITGATTLTTTGTATLNALTVNNAGTVGTTLTVGGTATVNALVSNGAIQGTTLSGSGNATVAGLTVNASAVIGTTLQAAGGVQATPIGNATASSGAFTTLTSSGLTTFTNATDSTGPTSGAVVITGGLGVGKDLNVTTEANIGNVTLNNLTISSNITNQGLNINPNGTGVTTINSGLNTSRTVINGTAANTLVVSGTQVGVNTSSFISGATFQVNALDSILLPKGAIGDRPGSPAAGMLRFSTSQGSIEWYNGSSWAIPTGDFTVVVANSQTGNGSATLFTLPVANASTAGTIVSINGVVQQPTSAYSITGANVTFTEAPASTDVIDFRVFTTTAQVTEVTDIAGTTGLFFDLPTAGSQITTIKTVGTESFSIQANSTARFTGNVEPSANITYSLGSTTNRWKDLWLSGSTIYLGNIQIQNTTGNTVSFVTRTGAPASLDVDISDPSGIQATPIGNATPSTGNFTTVDATGNISASYFTGNGRLLSGIDATSIQNGTSNVKVYPSGSVTTGIGSSNVFVVSSTGATVIGNVLVGSGSASSSPDCELNILASPQTVSYSLSGPSTTLGTDLHISGADASQTRIVQDSFGTSTYVAFTGRTARGTAATPTQTLSGDTLTQFTARGFSNGSLQFGNVSTGRIDIIAAENFTDTSRATNVQVFTTATGSITPTAIATFSSAGGLSVAGNVTVTNNIFNGGTTGTGNIGATGATFNTVFAKATTAQYADLAENYSGDAVYEPGTVVHFGGSQEVTLCDEDMCRRVAGVVSTNPAYLMNSHLQGIATPVALQGRVPCKVQGTVRLGDMMVSAGNGFARAEADPTLGSVIGKALADFDGIEGVIEVVVGRV